VVPIPESKRPPEWGARASVWKWSLRCAHAVARGHPLTDSGRPRWAPGCVRRGTFIAAPVDSAMPARPAPRPSRFRPGAGLFVGLAAAALLAGASVSVPTLNGPRLTGFLTSFPP